MGSPPMSPISPELKERILNEQVGSQVDDDLDGDVAETTFGVDGEVQTEKIPKHIYATRVNKKITRLPNTVVNIRTRNNDRNMNSV